MLLCNSCGTGWHRYCLVPALSEIPDSAWVCPTCTTKGITPASIGAKPLPPLASQPPPTRPKPPAHLKPLDGARIESITLEPQGTELVRQGYAIYAGLRDRRHWFEAAWDDGSRDLVESSKLHPMLLGKRTARRRATTTTHSTANLSVACVTNSTAATEEHPAAPPSVALATMAPPTSAEEAQLLWSILRVELFATVATFSGTDPLFAQVFANVGAKRVSGDGLMSSVASAKPDMLFLNVSESQLDSLWMSALAVAPVVVALVPVSYLAQGNPMRFAFLAEADSQSRLALGRCISENKMGVVARLWVIVFRYSALPIFLLQRKGAQ